MKKMYKGKVNSPQTQIIEDIGLTTNNIKVLDASVFPDGPNLAVIGNDAQAETIKYESINENILVGCVRGFQGKATAWKKDSVISRNFTEYDLNVIQENILELDNNKVGKVDGKELSSNDFTNEEKNKLEGIEIGANKYVHPSTHSANMITETSSKRFVSDAEKDKWNNKIDKAQGQGLISDAEKNKLANIEDAANKVTKISQLTNDKNFKTEAEIKTLINNSTKLKKEVVTSLPSSGKEDVIYLLKNKNDTNNYYTEYMWISGRWEIIGDTKVDLSDYAKKSEIDLSKLDKKYLQYKDKMLEDIDLNTFSECGIFLCNANQCKNPPEYFIDSWFPCYLINEYIIDSDGTKFYYQLAIGMTNSKCVYIRQGNKGSWSSWIPLVEETFTKEEKEKLKKLSSSRSATFVIANYDSSENSKAGADYVIQKNECAAEIINSFIAKLPSYGGKILLTEGNFNSKKNLSINFNKNNTIIEGYGDSTTIIDKLTKDERTNVIINIANGIENCKLLNLNIVHEASTSMYIKGSNNTIKNIKIKNNGTSYSVYIDKNANTNKLTNVNVESNKTPYLIKENSDNNRFSNCISTSNDLGFIINGSYNTFSNCISTSDSMPFTIYGTGNNLISCIAKLKTLSNYAIYIDSSSKYCICIANRYNGKGILSTGTNNILVNNVKIEDL